MRSAECGMAGQSRPKPPRGECRMPGEATQSHINATSKPPQSVLIANRLRPQSHHNATPKPPQCDPKATTMRQQSHLKPGEGASSSGDLGGERGCKARGAGALVLGNRLREKQLIIDRADSCAEMAITLVSGK